MAGYLVLWSVFWLFKLIRGKEGMGYGDFKLLAAMAHGSAGNCYRPLFYCHLLWARLSVSL
jgi:Flp pilus assembly protein protease CpaA